MTTHITRTDAHRPSAIVPTDYDFVAVWVPRWNYFYAMAATAVMMSERARVKAHMAGTGGRWAGHEHGGTCMICGAWANYLAVFHHTLSNEYIRCGEDCANKMFGGDARRFRAIRTAVEAAQAARAGWKKAEGVLASHGLGRVWEIFQLTQRPTADTLEGVLRMAGQAGDGVARMALRDLWLEQGLDPDLQPAADRFEERTIADIVGKLAKYGRLSDRQYQFLGSLAQKIDGRAAEAARQAELAAKRAAERATALDVPAGRRTVLVEVLKVEERDYADFGRQPVVRHVMTCRSVTGGYVLWGTVPAALVGDVERGSRIDLTATLEPSDRDPKFGFFKRPLGKKVA